MHTPTGAPAALSLTLGQAHNDVLRHILYPPFTPHADAAGATPAAPSLGKQPLFADDSLPTFFRRLAWSPDGAFLAVPAGVYRWGRRVY